MKKVYLVFTLLIAIAIFSIGCSNGSSSESSQGQENEKNSTDESNYPTKQLQMIIPAGPGGDTDLNGRLLSKYMEEELGENVVVTNVEGAGGAVGTEKAYNSKPDGYTVLFFHNSTILGKMLEISKYDYSDFKVAGIPIQDQTTGYFVNANSDYNSLNDLVDYAKENPGKVKVAATMGNFSHLISLMFEDVADVDFNIIDAGGGNEQKTALVAERVDVLEQQYSIAQPFVESGDFRPLGFMSEERNSSLSDIPTFKEQGVDLIMPKSYFFMFPKETPDEIVNQFTESLKNVTENEEFQKELDQYHVTANYMNPEESTSYLDELYEQYEKYKDNLLEGETDK